MGIWIVGMATAAACAAQDTPVSFDLAAAANKDIVYEMGAAAKAAKFGETKEATQAFVEQGVHGADGLPNGGKVSSVTEMGSYQLLPYSRKNVIEVGSNRDAPLCNARVDVPDGRYTALGMIVASVDKDSSFTLKLHYKDGTETVGWWEADDWYQPRNNRGNCIPAVANMDRVDASNGTLDDANHYQLYEFVFKDVDQNRILDAITIGNDPNRYDDSVESWGAVFAVNGMKAASP